jgi:hypothetical protein
MYWVVVLTLGNGDHHVRRCILEVHDCTNLWTGGHVLNRLNAAEWYRDVYSE